jgi:pumilio RNA-binding family
LAKHLKEEEEAHGMDIDDNGDTKNGTSLLMSSTNIIIDEVVNDLQTLSRHSYGCRVVQRMVEHFAEAQKSRVLDAIIACHTSLFDDVYGNYVIQCVVSNGRPADRDIIFQYITVNNNVMNLSKKKQASNVVETMLRHGDADQRKKIVQRMLDVSALFLRIGVCA